MAVETEALERVIITKEFVGIFFMAVCAVDEATNEEILEKCNRENPSGTTAGWSSVVRALEPGDESITEEHLPQACAEYPDRTHFLVGC